MKKVLLGLSILSILLINACGKEELTTPNQSAISNNFSRVQLSANSFMRMIDSRSYLLNSVRVGDYYQSSIEDIEGVEISQNHHIWCSVLEKTEIKVVDVKIFKYDYEKRSTRQYKYNSNLDDLRCEELDGEIISTSGVSEEREYIHYLSNPAFRKLIKLTNVSTITQTGPDQFELEEEFGGIRTTRTYNLSNPVSFILMKESSFDINYGYSYEESTFTFSRL